MNIRKYLTKCSGTGPTNSRKHWVMRSWKYVPNGWGLGNWGSLSDKWWVMSDEWWVKKIEWGVMSNGFQKTKQPPILTSQWSMVIRILFSLYIKLPIYIVPKPQGTYKSLITTDSGELAQ